MIGISLMGCGGDKAVSPSRVPNNPILRDVVILGDSLAVSPSSSDNFAVELQRQVDAKGYRWRIVNASVGGATTGDGVSRLEPALSSETRIVVLELGANDGLRGVPTITIQQNLATVIERVQARGIRVLLCGMETPPTHGWDYSVAFHRIFPTLATRYDVALVPFLLSGVALNGDLNGPDGIHPNSAGARQIAATVWSYLEPLIIQETAAASRAD
jgi:acyl-CoA thioesterase-1